MTSWRGETLGLISLRPGGCIYEHYEEGGREEWELIKPRKYTEGLGKRMRPWEDGIFECFK